MMLSDYIKGLLKSFDDKKCLELDIELTVNHNLVVDDEGKQKITLHLKR